MDRPTFVWNFERSEVYEIGAALLVLLAYPDDKSDAEMGDLHASLCARALWNRHVLNPDDTTPTAVKPQYQFREIEQFERDNNFTVKRLRERMIAGRMLIPFLQRAQLGRAFKLPPTVKRLSINQMAEFVLNDAGQSDVNNLKSRIWAPSRSVIHLAAAAAILGQELQKEGDAGFDEYLERRELIEAIVREAQYCESLIENDPRIPIKIENLIKVRLA